MCFSSYKYEEEIKNIPLGKTWLEERANLKARVHELEGEAGKLRRWRNYHHGHFLEYLVGRYLRWAKSLSEGQDLLLTIKNQEKKIGSSTVKEFLKEAFLVSANP